MDLSWRHKRHQGTLRQLGEQVAMPPQAHAGVGEALRQTYPIEAPSLPTDFMLLLDKLN